MRKPLRVCMTSQVAYRDELKGASGEALMEDGADESTKADTVKTAEEIEEDIQDQIKDLRLKVILLTDLTGHFFIARCSSFKCALMYDVAVSEAAIAEAPCRDTK
jgi:hypothetical protein